VKTDSPAFEIVALTRVFGTGPARVEALRGIDLRVERAQFVAIMGPSGSGKSTLLHLIGGLDTPTSGRVRIGGTDLGALDDDRRALLRHRQVGFIFQDFNLLDVLSAAENTALPLLIDGLSEAEAHRRALTALEWVDLAHRRDHLPDQLAAGEQQRVAIARALVGRPPILLADEPTGNLDSVSGDQILTLLRNLVDHQGQTVVMVTHDARQAALADRFVRLRDGVVVEEQALPPSRSFREVLHDLDIPS
jgi:putative ABC transport system ATP-binding protein